MHSPLSPRRYSVRATSTREYECLPDLVNEDVCILEAQCVDDSSELVAFMASSRIPRQSVTQSSSVDPLGGSRSLHIQLSGPKGEGCHRKEGYSERWVLTNWVLPCCQLASTKDVGVVRATRSSPGMPGIEVNSRKATVLEMLRLLSPSFNFVELNSISLELAGNATGKTLGLDDAFHR